MGVVGKVKVAGVAGRNRLKFKKMLSFTICVKMFPFLMSPLTSNLICEFEEHIFDDAPRSPHRNFLFQGIISRRTDRETSVLFAPHRMHLRRSLAAAATGNRSSSFLVRLAQKMSALPSRKSNGSTFSWYEITLTYIYQFSSG